MKMVARALPVELLDDQSTRQRFKELELAIEKVKRDIERAVAQQGADKHHVKLNPHVSHRR